MNAPANDSLPLFCELGWHRPEKLARWNDGYYFSKCSRCGHDLVRTAYGHWQVPRGYRVVWQPTPPENREKIELVAERELETAAAAAAGAGLPPHHASERVEAEAAPAFEKVATVERPKPAEAEPLPEPAAELDRPSWASETAPHLDETPAALPMAGFLAHSEREAADEPQNGSAAHALPEPAGVEIGRILESPVAAGDLAAEEAPPIATPDVAEEISADAAEPELPESPAEEAAEPAEGPEEIPQPEGGAVEEPAAVSPSLASVSDLTGNEPEPSPAQDELPILEVLRHASATPIPPFEAPEQPDGEEALLPGIVDEPGPAAAEPEVEAAEPVQEAAEEAAPPPRPERKAEPVRHYSDFDFMAEEEEDPIGSFWESAPAPQARTRSAPEPVPADSMEAPAMEAAGRTPTVADEPESVDQNLSGAATAAPWPQPAAEPEPQPARSRAPDDVPFFRSLGAAGEPEEEVESAPPRRTESGSVSDKVDETAELEEELPPWVNARSEEPSPAGSPPRKVALAALVSAALVVAVVALAGRANERPTLASAGSGRLQTAERPAPVPPQVAAAESGSMAAAAPLPPILPAREAAFVTASVLQCRSAPVEGSEPVRKLLRGSEVQILGREGRWTSVAHKGRQCWAATRFLSAVQPW